MGIIRVGTALTFALTPFWPSGMLSTLGMPLSFMGFFAYSKRKEIMERICCFYTSSLLLKPGSWLVFFPIWYGHSMGD